MAYKIQEKADDREYQLINLDETGDTIVHIKKATGNDQLRLEEICTPDSVSYKVDDISYSRRSQTPKYLEMAAKTWLAMTSCNIIDSNGKPLFHTDMKWGDFMAAYDKLPVVGRNEIYAAIVEENPHWDDPTFGMLG